MHIREKFAAEALADFQKPAINLLDFWWNITVHVGDLRGTICYCHTAKILLQKYDFLSDLLMLLPFYW